MAEKKLTRTEKLKKGRAENLKHWMEQDEILSKHREEAYNVGGQKQIDRLAKQGKKPMRDLISMLIDPGTEYFEIGLDTGYDIGKKRVYGGEVYEQEKRGHIPGGGLITGIGKVHGKDCMIFANENRYAAGTYFPITLKKHMRAPEKLPRCVRFHVSISPIRAEFIFPCR